MSLVSTQTATPQRKLPGGFIQTPAPQRPSFQPSIFRSNSTADSAPPAQNANSSALTSTNQNNQLQRTNGNPNGQPGQDLTPVALAARTINEALVGESRYPELESYVGQGVSADYDLSDNPAWTPFQKVKSYEIPEAVFEQANFGTLSTALGLLAELNHAYIVIDSALYLWDYTHPNPELIGYEENTHAITAVKLVRPKPGVFVPGITHLLVVATHAEIILIGVATQTASNGGKTVQLYSTQMSVPIRGIGCDRIEASSKSGRVFFTDKSTTSVWELTYQQEERWFKSKCDKVNHTGSTYGVPAPLASFWTRAETEFVKQLVVDDSRDLLYTLDNKSTIRVYHIKAPDVLNLCLTKTFTGLLSNIGHMVPRTELLGSNTEIVSISPISARESSRISLQALTSTGCRIFISALSGGYNFASATNPPSTMQVHHVKFPPKDPSSQMPAPQQQQQPGSIVPYQSNAPQIDSNSRVLTKTVKGTRFPPGLHLWAVESTQDPNQQRIFLSAPDAGRIRLPKDPAQPTKYPEHAQWLSIPGKTQDVGLITSPFAATSTPLGFANELATQFDVTPSEIAILGPTGIQTIRRKRPVDVFAAAVRYGTDSDGREGEVKKFVRLYGRTETAATALAVTCGQGSDVTSDERITQITEPDVIDYAREVFIQHGGKAMLNENAVLDNNTPSVENVRLSPRHDGTALYLSRLVRSIWKAPVIREAITPAGGLSVGSVVSLQKLRDVQRSLNSLQEFLEKNRTSIEGLAGPEALGRVSTKQEEVALQGEHRAMNALVQLTSSIIEGIAFVLVLFDERVEEILMTLQENSRQRLRQLTFETLFTSPDGRDLAKELVKAIVNRNIANGSNVDTVAEALRRRCGSFCSADDAVIFKAQEQVKRASEAGANAENGRMLLNESLRLFQKVAASLSMEHLQWAVEQYVSLQFYAGAIQLTLHVAQESDRANRALSWLRDGSPADDPRKAVYEARKRCYDLVHAIIQSVDQASQQSNGAVDGQYSLTGKRKAEAYDVINDSEDEAFQNNLYDWYMQNGWSDRLLDIESPFVVSYLQRQMEKDIAHAELLWRYFAHHGNFLDAAAVQLLLAKSNFALNLESRIAHLSRARTNASIRTNAISDTRQSRQQLLREVSDLLDVANIQDDILQRMKSDPRLTATRRPQVLEALDGPILDIGMLFNQYADQAGYYDICILIYNVADHRNPADIQATWQALIEQTHAETEQAGEPLPYEAVAVKVRTLGSRLRLADATFPVQSLLPMLERYALEYQRGVGPATWVLDLFIELEVSFETLLPVLEQMYYSNEQPFDGRNRKILAGGLVYLCTRWFGESQRSGDRVPFGGEENHLGVEEVLAALVRSGNLEGGRAEEAEMLRARIAQALR